MARSTIQAIYQVLWTRIHYLWDTGMRGGVTNRITGWTSSLDVCHALGISRPKSVFSIMFCILNKPESASPGLSAALSLSAAPFFMRLLRSERSGTFVEPEKRFSV